MLKRQAKAYRTLPGKLKLTLRFFYQIFTRAESARYSFWPGFTPKAS